MKPQIIGYEPGMHNSNMDGTIHRLKAEGAYKDQSTIIVIPALHTVATKAASSWLNMMAPPNQKIVRLFAQNMEVGEAYNSTMEQILANPELSKFKYVLCIEADNTVPPDGLVKLIAQMEKHPEFSAISGGYFTKGHGGVFQAWGDPTDPVLNFRPQLPVPGALIECCGLGQGFTLFRLDMFKDEKLRKPWFKTACSTLEGCYTQDLWLWSDARKYGHRCAVDCSVLIGHVDMATGFVW